MSLYWWNQITAMPFVFMNGWGSPSTRISRLEYANESSKLLAEIFLIDENYLGVEA
jgi:hypothetical protein